LKSDEGKKLIEKLNSWDSSDKAKKLFEKMDETATHIIYNIKPYPETVSPRKYGFSYDNANLTEKTEAYLSELKT